MLSPAPPLRGGPPRTLSMSASLNGRLLAARRRRLALRLRDWMGIGVITAFALTLFAVTFFSLLGR